MLRRNAVTTREETAGRAHPERMPARSELIADGVVHAIGIAAALAAGATLLAMAAFEISAAEYAALAFYIGSLVAAFGVSCAYNLWPQSPLKLVLRRADHSTIYLLIAGTYTPFLTQLPNSGIAMALVAFIWIATIVGVALKLLLPGRFDRLAVAFYLLIGWSGIVVIEPLAASIPPTAVTLMLAGGVVYSAGVIFFAWRSLKFQTAVWHGFVVAGAALHFAAIADTMVLGRLV